MAAGNYKYIIIGGGLAGASAIEGIREEDAGGDILMIGKEKNMPYDRPPLSKKLWFGTKKLEEIFLHDDAFYSKNGVELCLGTTVTGLDPSAGTITTDAGDTVKYNKLLLATGGIPRMMDIPGGRLEEICYYRTINDYKNIRSLAGEGKKALVVGGGFIGSEIAAALNMNKVEVTIVFPEDYLVWRVFPEGLGKAIQKHFIEKGINILNTDQPVSFEKKQESIITKTKNGKEIKSDFVIAGIGILPSVELAQIAGLNASNGITADEFLQTSNTDIYTAGDNTNFKSIALGDRMRIEHWDNSIVQGRTAGRNMAGGKIKYDHIPYFFSDLFEFGYEAVGDLDPRLITYYVWKKEFDTGIIYYLKEEMVRGVMLCNVWDKVPAARELIKKQAKIKTAELGDAIVF